MAKKSIQVLHVPNLNTEGVDSISIMILKTLLMIRYVTKFNSSANGIMNNIGENESYFRGFTVPSFMIESL